MSLWRRAPREVYRVYGEDQYLEGETAEREDSATVEPDSRGVASWAAFAADVPPASAGPVGGPSVPPGGSHAGRLVGVGLLMGVGLATLALVFLNISHRHGAASDLVGRGARVEAEQRVGHAADAGRSSVIAHSVNSRPVQAPRFSAPLVMTPVRVSESTLLHRVPAGGGSHTAPRLERAWSTALRAPGDGAPAMVAVEPPTPVAIEPSGQDEFGFEQ
ncbi:MAG: hypothetical protein WBV77_10155 [Solirubrobacteraceae bacterium]|jgi:hypothetical protein